MSIYLNNYKPPPPAPSIPFECHLSTPPGEYDFNFCGGEVYELRTDKVVMVPFVPSRHAMQYFDEIKDHPQLMKHMPYARRMDQSLDNCLHMIELAIRRPEGTCLWAIFDLTKEETSSEGLAGPCPVPEGHPKLGCMAGVMGLLNTSRDNLATELGHVVILPKAQRTHVSTHAIALLQHYALDHPHLGVFSPASKRFESPQSQSSTSVMPLTPPYTPLSASFPQSIREMPPMRALGFRRLQWQAHVDNVPSAKAAQRMGFVPEGIARYQRIVKTLIEEKGREGDGGSGGSRSTWIGAISWVDWAEKGVKDKVDALVAR